MTETGKNGRKSVARTSVERSRTHGQNAVGLYCSIYRGYIEVLTLTGKYARAMEMARKVVIVSAVIDDPKMKAYGLHIIGHAYFRLGDYSQALQHLEEASVLRQK